MMALTLSIVIKPWVLVNGVLGRRRRKMECEEVYVLYFRYPCIGEGIFKANSPIFAIK